SSCTSTTRSTAICSENSRCSRGRAELSRCFPTRRSSVVASSGSCQKILLHFLYMLKFTAIERPLLPPLKHDDVPIHSCYTSIVRLYSVDGAFDTDEGYRHSGQNLDRVADFEFRHSR